MKKRIRFRMNGAWSKWYDFNKVKVPDECSAIEVSEEMTLKEVKKRFPELIKH